MSFEMSVDLNAKSLSKIKSLSDFREELGLQGPQTLYIIVVTKYLLAFSRLSMFII